MVVFKRLPKDTPPGPSAAAAASQKGGTSAPFADVITALQEGRDSDAVRSFIPGLSAHPLPADTDMLSALREEMGRKHADRLVLALASFPCPHCRGGSDTCAVCQGSGRGEERRFACMTCRGLGVSACDFCGGSGLATYSFVPAGLRPAVAAVRSQMASERVVAAVREPLPAGAPPEQMVAQRKALAKQVLEFGRDLSILTNAAQVARHLRCEDPVGYRAFSGRLFARSSRSAKAAQLRMAEVFLLLAGASRHRSRGTHPADTTAFEEERAELFEEEARRLEKLARHRPSLFPGR